MRKHILVFAMAIVLTVGVMGQCLAHDVVIPAWRGAPGSTFQEWLFDTSANPASPAVVTNPYGSPSAAVSVGPYGSGWLLQIPGLGTQSGYWDMGSAGTIAMSVPNTPAPPSGCAMLIAVQSTYFRDITQAPTVAVAGGARLYGETRVVESVSTGGDWRVDQSYWRVPVAGASSAVTLTSSSQWGAVIDQVVVDALCVESRSSVGLAKLLPDGTLVELTGPVVTRTFESYFYIEDALRVAGIRVDCPSSAMPSEGTTPTVVGTLSTVDGERVITQASVITGPSAAIPHPLAMNNRATASKLSPVGLYVRLWGRAHVSGGGTTFTIEDGDFQPVRVELHGATAPADGSFVRITGALGADTSGPILRVTARDSVQSVP